MSINEPPELPEGLSPYGSLPGDSSQPTPEEMEASQTEMQQKNNRLEEFIDLDDLEKLTRDEKVKLVQIICERFVFGHLNGANGTIGYSVTLRPEVTDRELVSMYGKIATRLWGQGVALPQNMDHEDLAILRGLGVTDEDGYTHYFENIIQPPKKEPNLKNPYLSQQALVYHDARLLDALIGELYMQPLKNESIGFSMN